MTPFSTVAFGLVCIALGIVIGWKLNDLVFAWRISSVDPGRGPDA